MKLGHRAVSSDEEDSSEKPDGPSEKAWGKRKAVFYNTDYVDDELGGNLLTKINSRGLLYKVSTYISEKEI